MEELELAAVSLISNVGMAKSLIMEALVEARNGKYEEADKKIAEANEYLLEGHRSHMGLIQREADGEKIPFALILMHAEDQLMSVEIIKDLVNEMILMYKRINSK